MLKPAKYWQWITDKWCYVHLVGEFFHRLKGFERVWETIAASQKWQPKYPTGQSGLTVQSGPINKADQVIVV
jgi:hypothetical protein